VVFSFKLFLVKYAVQVFSFHDDKQSYSRGVHMIVDSFEISLESCKMLHLKAFE